MRRRQADRASCIGARGAGPGGTCSPAGAPPWSRSGARLPESETCPGTRSQTEGGRGTGRLGAPGCEGQRVNQKRPAEPEPPVPGPSSLWPVSRLAESWDSEVHRPRRRRAKRRVRAGAGVGPGRPSGRAWVGGRTARQPAHAEAGQCAPSHTHTRRDADKGVLCFLRGREGVCESAATRRWWPRW